VLIRLIGLYQHSVCALPFQYSVLGFPNINFPPVGPNQPEQDSFILFLLSTALRISKTSNATIYKQTAYNSEAGGQTGRAVSTPQHSS
jgi:hypothetical protein